MTKYDDAVMVKNRNERLIKVLCGIVDRDNGFITEVDCIADSENDKAIFEELIMENEYEIIRILKKALSNEIKMYCGKAEQEARVILREVE